MKRCPAVISLLFCFLVAPLVWCHAAWSAENEASRIVETFHTIKKRMTGGEKSFGIDTGIIFSDDYDAGFGTGIRFNQTFEHPYIDRPFLQSSPTVQFWGASNETTDISVVGIIECLTHRIPMRYGITGYAGLMVGYYYIYRTINPSVGTTNPIRKINTNSFDIFITGGVEYKLKKKSSVFVQLKYGDTAVSREVHLLFGLNLNYWKEDIKPAKPKP